MSEKPITIRLSPEYARHLALNVDGWVDAGACDGGLEPDERLALLSTYDQIVRGLKRRGLSLSRPHRASDSAPDDSAPSRSQPE